MESSALEMSKLGDLLEKWSILLGNVEVVRKD